MPKIYTGRNHVSVGKALPGDRFVATYIMPQYGPETLLCVQPIEQLEAAVRWAWEMAEYMAHPLRVTPIQSEDEWLRQLCIAVGCEGLGREDPDERQAGLDLLIKLGVLKQ